MKICSVFHCSQHYAYDSLRPVIPVSSFSQVQWLSKQLLKRPFILSVKMPSGHFYPYWYLRRSLTHLRTLALGTFANREIIKRLPGTWGMLICKSWKMVLVAYLRELLQMQAFCSFIVPWYGIQVEAHDAPVMHRLPLIEMKQDIIDFRVAGYLEFQMIVQATFFPAHGRRTYRQEKFVVKGPRQNVGPGLQRKKPQQVFSPLCNW